MKAVIVGAGIGGLASAIALHKAGYSVEVLEKASTLSEVGAGVQISPNGMRALEALGVVSELEPDLFDPPSIRMVMGRSGRTVFELPMASFAENRWGARFVQVHRADLQQVLLNKLQTLAGDVIRTSRTVTGYVRTDVGASVLLAGDPDDISGDLVVAADGVHSAIRSQMHGGDMARFTGAMAWRCTVPVDRLGALAPPPTGCIWAGAGRHAVTTRIRAGRVVNFVGVVEQTDWQEEGWSIPGHAADALKDFDGWAPQLRHVLASANQLNRWALLERAPIDSWSDGPVTLLGDAAHPMLPSMAQGAVQALEDAVVLGLCLKGTTDIAAALARYQAIRAPRTARIQKRSAQNLALFHHGGGAAIMRYAPLWALGKVAPAILHRQQDWIYGYDPLASLR